MTDRGGGGLLLTSQPSRSPRSPSAFSKAVMRSHENLHPQYQWSQSSGEGRREGWVWGGEFRGLCQGLVSSDIDTPRLGTNSAERAQTSRTPMSSWRDYVSRRPQEPWKYLDISSPPLPPHSSADPLHHLLRLGETRFQVARDRTLKGFSLAASCLWPFFFLSFLFSVPALSGSKPPQTPP